jgi:hypothetical protein
MGYRSHAVWCACVHAARYRRFPAARLAARSPALGTKSGHWGYETGEPKRMITSHIPIFTAPPATLYHHARDAVIGHRMGSALYWWAGRAHGIALQAFKLSRAK